MAIIAGARMKRGIYILPSLFTLANLSAGFLSVIWSIQYRFEFAAWAILASIVLDIIDGRVARWTRTTSRFGIELDSLADLIAFGVAPAILMYQVVLHSMRGPGVAIALFFVIAGALRLARFNIKTLDGESSPHFVGLPTPAAAGILASFVLSYQLFNSGGEMTAKTIPLLMQRMPFFFKSIAPLMVLISILMISNVPYVSFKKMKLSRPKSLQLLIFILIGILLIVTYPQNTIFILFLIYLVTGIAEYVTRYWRIRRSLRLMYKDTKHEQDNHENKGIQP